MTIDQLIFDRDDIHFSITADRINWAIDTLRADAQELSNYRAVEMLGEIEAEYNTLCRNFVDGADHPERIQLYNSLCNRLHGVADDVYDDKVVRANDSLRAKTLYYLSHCNLAKKMAEYRALNVKHRQFVSEHNDCSISQAQMNVAEEIFDYVWTHRPTASDAQLLGQFVTDADVPRFHRDMMFGAVLLLAMYRFSAHYVDMLLDVIEQSKMNARAIVVLALTLILHPTRLDNCMKKKSRLMKMMKDSDFNSAFFDAYMAINQMRAIEPVGKMMAEDIIPAFSNAKTSTNSVQSGNLTVISLDSSKDDAPTKDPKVQKGMEQVTRWQLEGIDVFWASFRFLKGYEFFNHINHWFMPFDPHVPQLSHIVFPQGDIFTYPLVGRLMENKIMCESDKYSLLLSLEKVPAEKKEAMLKMHDAEMDQNEAVYEHAEGSGDEKLRRAQMNTFTHDVFRVAKAHSCRREFPDVLTAIKLFYHSYLYDELYNDLEHDAKLADFLLQHGFHNEAYQVYHRQCTKDQTQDVDLMKQTAYCAIKAKNYAQAVEMLAKAEFLSEHDAWIKRNLALCYREQKQFDKENFYLKQTLELTPDDADQKLALCRCLMQLRKYTEVLPMLFELDYNFPSTPEVERMLLRCAFHEERFETTIKYFQLVPEDQLQSEDYIMMGHALLCTGRRNEAVEAYSHVDSPDEDVFFCELRKGEKVLYKYVDRVAVRLLINAALVRKSES